jgi:uncharacterized protein YjeT (DUF2065 family)
MRFAIQLIGIVIIVQVCIFLFRIDLLRGLIRFISRGSRLYIIAAVRLALAVVFFIGATQCVHKWMIIAIAVILLLSGLIIFTLKPAAFKKLLAWYQNRSDLSLRLMAAIGIIFGALIIYAA